MTRANGYRSPRKIFTSDANDFIDHCAELNVDMAIKTVKSSTLNRHHWTKPKSPGTTFFPPLHTKHSSYHQ